MGKILYEDKALIETLRKLGFGYRTTVAKFPGKGLKLCWVKAICKRVDEYGLATEQKSGSDRPKTAQRKMLDTSIIEHWLRHFTNY